MASVASFFYSIGGVATDADTVTLSDASATYGIRRVSDGVVIVAAGAATTRVGVGTYQYDYSLLGLDPLQSYQISFRGVKAGQPTQHAAAMIAVSAGASTLLNLRRRLAQQLGSLRVGTTGARRTTDGGYEGAATGTAARRTVASSDLAHVNAAGTGSNLGTDRYDGAYVYFPSIQRQFPVANDGYNGNVAANTVTSSAITDPVGTITLARPDDAAIPAARAFELHTVLPVVDAQELIGLHTHLRRAFQTIKVRDRLPLPGVAGQYRYDLSAYPWLREGQLLGVYGSESAVGVQGQAIPSRLRFDAGTPYLELQWAVATGDTAYLDVRRPIGSWVRVGGTWADSVSGPVAELDEVAYDPETVASVAAYYAYDHLAHVDPRGLVPDAARRRDRLAAIYGPLLQQERQESEADSAYRARLQTRSWGSWRVRGPAWP